MKPSPELLELIPEELRSVAHCSYHSKQETWYVYRRDGYVYDKEKKRSIDLRTPLGQIKNNTWSYSNTWLRQRQIEALQAKVAEPKNPIEEKANSPRVREAVKQLQEKTEAVQDPRQTLKNSFGLEPILCVMCLAMLGGFTSAASIASYWSRFRYELSLIFPDFPAEDISHDCINRLLRLISPDNFLALMEHFTRAPLAEAMNRVIHIDGKALRGCKGENCAGGRYILNVYESGSHLLMAQELVGVKQNEVTVVVDVLKSLDLREGDIVTGDALHTQRNTVAFLNERKAGWCFALKENQSSLASEVSFLFASTDDSRKKIFDSDVECAHGRIETRHTQMLPGSMLSKRLKDQWPGLAKGSLIMTVTTRKGKSNDKIDSSETRYFISSISPKESDAVRKGADVIRSHWSIENSLHWVLDVVFNEDRVHATDSAYITNRSLLNKAAVNVLRVLQATIEKKTGKKISINLLKENCSTPFEALETLATFFEDAELPLEVKG